MNRNRWLDFRCFAVAGIIATTMACAPESRPKSESPDIKNFVLEEKDTWVRPTDCRANIAKAMCVVDPTKEGEDNKPRTCLGGEAPYAHVFEELYDNYPPALQKMFCSIRFIFVENKLLSTAYAGTATDKDDKQLPGVYLGIRRSIVDSGMTYAQWSTWKEQLNFGGRNDSYDFIPQVLPVYSFKIKKKLNDFLYSVVAHEFGHFFDFGNDVNEFKAGNCKEENEDCMASSAWSKLSWKTMKIPLESQDYSYRYRLCFYRCTEVLAPDILEELYTGLDHTNFISSYASTNPWDDFAETVNYLTSLNYLQARAKVAAGKKGVVLDITSKLKSSRFKAKRAFVENLLTSKELKYP